LCVAAVYFAWPGAARAGNPDYRLRSIETEHFVINYPAGLEQVASRVAQLAERAHDDVSAELGHDVTLKTQVWLSDSTDTANGSANAIPYPQIRLNATAPGTMSVLDSYDDWLDILVTHEYVHVVHIDTVHGLPRLLNALLGFYKLGKVAAPNIVQPTWIVEGLATMEESYLSSAGRHRSAIFDMFMRMAVIEDRFTTIDRLSNQAKIFPHGSSVYLYGLHLMHYIAKRYGHDKLAELSHIYGGRILPFGINRALQDVIGVGFDELWTEFRADATRRFEAEARRIRARGLRQGRRLTFSTSTASSGQHTRFPFWSSDDQWIYFYDDDGHKDSGIKRIPSEGSRVRQGVGIGMQGAGLDVEAIINVEDASLGSFASADEKEIIFERSATHDFRYGWHELYRWRGPDPEAREQLTFGMRAREPDVSPDGRSAVFARNDLAQSRLAFLDLDTLEVSEAKPLGRFAQVFEPDWSPDGKRVAFSAWREGGYRDIYVYDRPSGEVTRLTKSRWLDTAPTWTPDGRYLLFSSDRSAGVMNLHAYELETGELFQVSNVLGGAFEPAISHDGQRIAYLGFSSTGYDLWVMPFDPSNWLEALPNTGNRPLADEFEPTIDSDRGRAPSLNSRRYQAWRTFFPRTLMPSAIEFQSTEDFLTGLSVTTDISDFVGNHRVAGKVEYLPSVQRVVGLAAYSYTRFFTNFHFNYGRNYRQWDDRFYRYAYDQSESELSGDAAYTVVGHREIITDAQATTSVPVLRSAEKSASLGLTYSLRRYNNLDDGVPVDPNAPAAVLPESGNYAGIQLNFSYSDLEGVRYAFRSNKGRAVGATIGVYDPVLGSNYRDLRAEATFSQRIGMPWRGHQVLGLRFASGATAGGLRRRGGFNLSGIGSYQDTIRTVLNRGTSSEVRRLRGYGANASFGRYYGLLQTEYRIPIWDVDRGIGSAVPLALERVAFVMFSDWGMAWTLPPQLEDLLGSVGASLLFDLNVGYGDAVRLKFLYARGLDEELGVNFFQAQVLSSF
jgi:hypothetical protein